MQKVRHHIIYTLSACKIASSGSISPVIDLLKTSKNREDPA